MQQLPDKADRAIKWRTESEDWVNMFCSGAAKIAKEEDEGVRGKVAPFSTKCANISMKIEISANLVEKH